METEIEELASLVKSKKEEFSEYLEKVGEVEGKALEYNELMKSEVNNVFDGIAASVEAQRNEALQSVSQGVKVIWAQKEMVKVSQAQLDSFTRFADHTHKCKSDASYIAMAAQGVKLMKRLRDTHGDESTLEHKGMVFGTHCNTSPLHVPLNELFVLGQPSFKFSPVPGSKITDHLDYKVKVKLSLQVGGANFPEFIPPPHESCNLQVTASYDYETVSTEVQPSHQSSWTIIVAVSRHGYHSLIIRCMLSGAVSLKSKVNYMA